MCRRSMITYICYAVVRIVAFLIENSFLEINKKHYIIILVMSSNIFAVAILQYIIQQGLSLWKIGPVTNVSTATIFVHEARYEFVDFRIW